MGSKTSSSKASPRGNIGAELSEITGSNEGTAIPGWDCWGDTLAFLACRGTGEAGEVAPAIALWLGSQRTFFFLHASQAFMMRIRCAWSLCSLVLQPRVAVLVTSRPSVVRIFIPGMSEKSDIFAREEVGCLADDDDCFLLREKFWGVGTEEEVEGVDAAGVARAGPHDQVGAMGEAVKLDPYPESWALLGELDVEPTQQSGTW